MCFEVLAGGFKLMVTYPRRKYLLVEKSVGMILRMEIYFKMYKFWRILLIFHMPTINAWLYFCKNIQISKDFI
jgi:hypothetical protein